jgi:hypothetical protein
MGDNTGGGAVVLRPVRFHRVLDLNWTPLYLSTQFTIRILNTDLRWTFWNETIA